MKKGQKVIIKHRCGHEVELWQLKISKQEIKDEQNSVCFACKEGK